MSVGGEQLWEIYDRRETAIYTSEEKERCGLGPLVENVSLLADRERLLAFVRNNRQGVGHKTHRKDQKNN
jgi:hypothetical protein